MKQLIRDTPTGVRIIIQEVPEDASDFRIKYNTGDLEMLIDGKWLLSGFTGLWHDTILGTVDKSGVYFDCFAMGLSDDPKYGNKHFLSFLNREGVCFENILGSEQPKRKTWSGTGMVNEWQSEQEKVWQRAVIIKIG